MEFIWADKVDGQDDVLAEDINYIASAVGSVNTSLTDISTRVNDLEKTTGNVVSVNGKVGEVVLNASDVDAPTNEEVNTQISNIKGQVDTYAVVLNNLENSKADKDLANVDNSVFLAKLNSVLPDGDEVSY